MPSANLWADAEALWDSSTKHALKKPNVTDFVALINTSAAISGYPLTYTRDVLGRYTVDGDSDLAAAFAAQWETLLKAHADGVAKIDATLGPVVFINWNEPVIDIQLVIVLFNPVWTDYDQRNSATVKKWWEMFEEDTKQPSQYWQQHSVFLDLVPILDSGKSEPQPGEEREARDIVDGVGDKCVAYVVSRLESYKAQFEQRHEGKKFQVMLASGTTASRNKNVAVSALQNQISALGPIDYYDYGTHPSRLTYVEDPTARAKYSEQNKKFLNATNGWVPADTILASESIERAIATIPRKQQMHTAQQYKNLVMLLTRASRYTDAVTAELSFIAATDDNGVKAACGLEVIVLLLKQADTAAATAAASEAYAKQTDELAGFDKSDQQKLSQQLITAVSASVSPKQNLAGAAKFFNVPAVYQLATTL